MQIQSFQKKLYIFFVHYKVHIPVCLYVCMMTKGTELTFVCNSLIIITMKTIKLITCTVHLTVNHDGIFLHIFPLTHYTY